MKVHEYQAKEIFKAGGIPTPPSIVAETPEEAQEAAGTIKKTSSHKIPGIDWWTRQSWRY